MSLFLCCTRSCYPVNWFSSTFQESFIKLDYLQVFVLFFLAIIFFKSLNEATLIVSVYFFYNECMEIYFFDSFQNFKLKSTRRTHIIVHFSKVNVLNLKWTLSYFCVFIRNFLSLYFKISSVPLKPQKCFINCMNYVD